MTNSTYKVYKEISAIPTPYVPNATYYVRIGTGIDIYVANSTGNAVFKHNTGGLVVSTTDPTTPSTDDIWIKKEVSTVGQLQFINGLIITYPEQKTVGASLKLKTESGILTTQLT